MPRELFKVPYPTAVKKYKTVHAERGRFDAIERESVSAIHCAARHPPRIKLARPRPVPPRKGRPAALGASPSRLAQRGERGGEGAKRLRGCFTSRIEPRRLRSPPFGRAGGHLRFHLAQHVGQGLAGLLAELFVEHHQIHDAVDAKTPEVIAQLAPGRQRPDLAPVEATQWARSGRC